MRAKDQRCLLDRLNRDINKTIKDKKVNNLNLFVATENGGKLSITLNPDLIEENNYHGLHPKFDEKMLRNFLVGLESNSKNKFWMAIDKIQGQDGKLMNIITSGIDDSYDTTEEYMLKLIEDKSAKQKIEISLLGKAVLQMASHFGYNIFVKDIKIYNQFKQELNERYGDNSIFYRFDDAENSVKLLGLWPIDIIKNICSNFYITESEDNLYLQKGKKRIEENELYSLLSFKNKNLIRHFKILNSDIYYSGVMPCVRSIKYEKNLSLSKKVKYLIFNVVKTTFATLDAMDNSKVLKHPFFDGEHRKRLLGFNHYEDVLQNKYLYSEVVYNLDKENDQLDYEEKMVRKLNGYLNNSLNTHTIAVSSNLVTEDGYLIAGKRGALNIDAGEYYCSANGQTEFRDENVSFYRKSVFEDMPTMDYSSKHRVDLNKEIERECIAELGVASYGIDWDYYGVSYLSINNNIDGEDIESINKSENVDFRRMHFNVLTSNTISQTLREVIKSQGIATESFENETVVGIKTRVFKDKLDFIKNIGLNIYRWLDENKDKIFLLLIFISILLGRINYSNISIKDFIDIFLLIVYLTMFTFTWYKDRKVRKQIVLKNYYLPRYLDNNNLNTEKVLKKLSKKADGANFHAIFNIMYMLYFLSLSQKDDMDSLR